MERYLVKLRHALLLLSSVALVAAGCGSDSDDSKSDDAKMTKQEQAAAKDAEAKAENVKDAEAAFEKADDDVGACRNLAMAWIAKASPASSTDPKEPPKLPEDREDSLKSATVTLEKCVEIDEKDRDVKQMLASTYMAQSDYDKATPLLEELASSAKGQERPNAYYAWGLAASNAQDYDEAITAWTTFTRVAPKNDPRIKQVRQSIAALRAAARAPKPDADAAPADDAESSDSADSEDSGSDSEDEG